MIRTMLNLFTVVVNACTEFWSFISTPIQTLFNQYGIALPSAVTDIFGNSTFGEILLGLVGVFVVITFIKWIVGIIT